MKDKLPENAESRTEEGLSGKNELLYAFEELLNAATDYVEYKHNGDPWCEDARTMGEMELDDLKRNGRLDDFRKLLDHHKMISKTKKRLNEKFTDV